MRGEDMIVCVGWKTMAGAVVVVAVLAEVASVHRMARALTLDGLAGPQVARLAACGAGGRHIQNVERDMQKLLRDFMLPLHEITFDAANAEGELDPRMSCPLLSIIEHSCPVLRGYWSL